MVDNAIKVISHCSLRTSQFSISLQHLHCKGESMGKQCPQRHQSMLVMWSGSTGGSLLAATGLVLQPVCQQVFREKEYNSGFCSHFYITNYPASGGKFTKKMLRLLTDCWEIVERLVRLMSARREIAEQSLKARFPQRPLRDCFEPVQNLMETKATIAFAERSWKIMEDLRDHRVLTERPLRDLSNFVDTQWSLDGLSMVSPLWKGPL